MITRKLGYTDLNFTVVGLGTWALGGTGWQFSWGEQDDVDSISAIHTALDLGINWIDTAAIYGLGHSEEVLGKAIKGMSKKPYIATKCGRHAYEDGSLYGKLDRRSILTEVNNSLRRLQVEIIDLYQIHWPLPDEQIEEGWSTLADLVREGKIRYAGVSNFNIDQLKRTQAIHPVASLQPPYSMLRRDLEGDLLNFCHANQIGVIVYSPLQKGLLTGKITGQWFENLPADDHRRNDPNFQSPRREIYLDLMDHLKSIAGKYNCSLAQLAIAWAIRNPSVTAAIVGARNPSQIIETSKASSIVVSTEDLQLIDNLLRTYQHQIQAV